MNESRQALSIQGLSLFAGGDYDAISISGLAIGRGAVSAGRLRINGIGRLCNQTEIGTCSISGRGIFRSKLIVDKLEIDGVCRVGGNLKARSVNATGRVHIAKDVACDHLVSSGSWNCHGNLSAEDCQITGSIRIGGVLTANSVCLSHDGSSQLKELIADRILIRRSSDRRNSLGKTIARILGVRPILRALHIEGDDVDIDAVRAKFICGKRIRIGPDCVVDKAEFSESIDIHSDATVKRCQRTSD